jgi:release factor glutamine methyltransferase
LPDRAHLESLETLVRRLEGGEAFPYVVGHREFFGIDFELTPDVLIPRPETELLVERAIAWLEATLGSRNIVDIGTGSGCIAISLALKVPHGRVLGTDISMPAILVAARNVRRLGVADRWTCSAVTFCPLILGISFHRI